MMFLTLLTLAVAACGVLWWVLAVAMSLLALRLSAWLERLGPSDRSWCLLGLALFPPLLAVFVTMLVFVAPESVMAIARHCHGSDCGAHAPFIASSGAALMAFSLLAGVAIAGWITTTALALWRTSRITRTFAALARPGADRSFRVLDCKGFLACCIGIWQPQVVVSRELAAKADPEQLGIVLMHEYAHAVRGDNLRKLLAGVATLPWPWRRRKALLAALHDAAEQSCDAFVAREIGDPGRVANTIRCVSRWTGPTGTGIERSVYGRIERLLHAGCKDGRILRIYALALPLVMIVIATAVPALHYCAEALLRLF